MQEDIDKSYCDPLLLDNIFKNALKYLGNFMVVMWGVLFFLSCFSRLLFGSIGVGSDSSAPLYVQLVDDQPLITQREGIAKEDIATVLEKYKAPDAQYQAFLRVIEKIKQLIQDSADVYALQLALKKHGYDYHLQVVEMLTRQHTSVDLAKIVLDKWNTLNAYPLTGDFCFANLNVNMEYADRYRREIGAAHEYSLIPTSGKGSNCLLYALLFPLLGKTAPGFWGPLMRIAIVTEIIFRFEVYTGSQLEVYLPDPAKLNPCPTYDSVATKNWLRDYIDKSHLFSDGTYLGNENLLVLSEIFRRPIFLFMDWNNDIPMANNPTTTPTDDPNDLPAPPGKVIAVEKFTPRSSALIPDATTALFIRYVPGHFSTAIPKARLEQQNLIAQATKDL